MQVGSQTAEEMYSLMRPAILEKAIVAVSYRGSIREMCPHVLGKKKGPLYALLYPFAGESATGLKFDGSPGNWRCLCIDEISHVALRKAGGEWHTASNYSSMQNCVDEIDFKVETRAA